MSAIYTAISWMGVLLIAACATALVATLCAASVGLWLAVLDQLRERHRRQSRPPQGSYGPPTEDWRRRFNHENTNRPSGPPPRFDPGRVQRTHGNAEPTTSKPAITPKGQGPGGAA